jgi:hypothetical protein
MRVKLLTRNYAIMDNDEILPVVHWINGKEIDVDMMEAAACVIGPTKDGKWIPHQIDWENAEINRVN